MSKKKKKRKKRRRRDTVTIKIIFSKQIGEVLIIDPILTIFLVPKTIKLF